MDNCQVSYQVMTDMKNVYNDLTIITLYWQLIWAFSIVQLALILCHQYQEDQFILSPGRKHQNLLEFGYK